MSPVQAVIDHVAEIAAGRSLPEVEQLLTDELARAGLRPPTRTWFDSVAREIAVGGRYVVSLEAIDEPGTRPGGHEEAYARPARLTVVRDEAAVRAVAAARAADRARVRRTALKQLGVVTAGATVAVLAGRFRRRSRRETDRKGNDRHDR